MSLLTKLVNKFLFPPEPTTAEKVIDAVVGVGKTTLEVSELINETLPEKGPTHVEDHPKALGY